MKKVTLDETEKALSISASHDNILVLKFRYDQPIVLAKTRFKISLDDVSASTRPKFTNLTKIQSRY